MKQSIFNGKPLLWDDDSNVHACVESEVHPGIRLIWTCCRRDVPDGMAYTRDDGGNDVTCLACQQAMGAPLP